MKIEISQSLLKNNYPSIPTDLAPLLWITRNNFDKKRILLCIKAILARLKLQPKLQSFTIGNRPHPLQSFCKYIDTECLDVNCFIPWHTIKSVLAIPQENWNHVSTERAAPKNYTGHKYVYMYILQGSTASHNCKRRTSKLLDGPFFQTLKPIWKMLTNVWMFSDLVKSTVKMTDYHPHQIKGVEVTKDAAENKRRNSSPCGTTCRPIWGFGLRAYRLEAFTYSIYRWVWCCWEQCNVFQSNH